MTRIFDDPLQFTDDALDGFVAANRSRVARVDGGVVRSTATPDGQVAVVIGGGSGHYPAFAGLVGRGLAAAAVCGNVFTSPGVAQALRVARAADRGGGILFSYGNYAGDVLNFGEAEATLRGEGIEVRTVLCTDDLASAGPAEVERRRGIAGDFTVFRIAGAAAEAGHRLDKVERLARKANTRTRTLGVAFGGCTLPGADRPLFTVPDGQMSIGLGIHGEPGIDVVPLASASELAGILVGRLLAERPEGSGDAVVPILNGLGTVKYEELFILYGRIAELLAEAGLEIVEPECGELVTSLDMAGLSLTLFWVDDELRELWAAPADAPAYRKGAMPEVAGSSVPPGTAAAQPRQREDATPASRRLARLAASLFAAAEETVAEHETQLGDLDAFAGDGDHGVGMLRGTRAAALAAGRAVADGCGIRDTLTFAADEWSERAGGTSGALWATALAAAAASLGNRADYSATDAVVAARAAVDAITARGGASVGDKTMVDAIEPWVAELERAQAAGAPLALRAAASAATAAAASTAGLRPALGRARPLAERSLGHPDPGATSFALIVTRIADEPENT